MSIIDPTLPQVEDLPSVASDPQAILPAIKVSWDEASHGVNLQFEPKDFRTWDFISMVLKEALRKAVLTRDLMTQQAIQGQTMQAMQAQQLALQAAQQNAHAIRRNGRH